MGFYGPCSIAMLNYQISESKLRDCEANPSYNVQKKSRKCMVVSYRPIFVAYFGETPHGESQGMEQNHDSHLYRLVVCVYIFW